MHCANCRYADIWGGYPIRINTTIIECSKYGILCDTTHPSTRQCIEDDCDVIWRAAREKGSRYNG